MEPTKDTELEPGQNEKVNGGSVEEPGVVRVPQNAARPAPQHREEAAAPSQIVERLGYGKVWCAMLLLMVLQVWFGHTDAGQWLELRSFSFLERLLPDTTPKRLPVIVLDISQLTGGSDRANLAYMTSRKELWALLVALHTVKAAAIGIDVDFSPGVNGLVAGGDDFRFFDKCANLGTPVLLGVNRNRRAGAAAWLGALPYSYLAASIAATKTPDGETLPRVAKELTQKFGTENLSSMGQALTVAYRREFPDTAPTPPIPTRFLANSNDEGYLANYSKVDQLARERSSARTPDAIIGTSDDFAHKMVILGDLSDERMDRDFFRLPGGGKRPGVLYHASAAYTFAVEPVYEFSAPVRFVFDIGLTLPFFAAVFMRKRIRTKAKPNFHAREKWVERGALLISFVLCFFVGGACILTWRILWLEALVAGFFVILHGFLGEKLQEIEESPWFRNARDATARRVRKFFRSAT